MERFISCNKILELLSPYFDGELCKEESTRIKSHIIKCKKCTQEFKYLKQISRLIKNSVTNIELPKILDEQEIVDILYTEINCNEVLEHLNEYVDNEVGFKLHFLISKHLNHCESCNEQYNELLKLNQFIDKSLSEIDEENFNIADNLDINIDEVLECHHSQDNLSSYIDRELDRDEIVSISKHLLSCKYCRQDFEDLKSTKNAVKKYFENFKHKELNFSESLIVDRALKSEQKTIFTLATTAMFIIAGLTWFSISSIEPNIIKNVYKKQTDTEQKAPAYYVNAEDYMLMTANSDCTMGVIPIRYENK